MQILYLLAAWLFADVVSLSNLVAICILLFSIIYRYVYIKVHTLRVCKETRKRWKNRYEGAKCWVAILECLASKYRCTKPWSISSTRLIASRYNAGACNEWYSCGADIQSHSCVYKLHERISCDNENWLVFQQQKFRAQILGTQHSDLEIIRTNLSQFRQIKKRVSFYMLFDKRLVSNK